METIPKEVRLNEFYKYLPYEDIVNLCQANIEFSSIYKSNETWIYLLYRDFIIKDKDVRDKYLLYKSALNYFSQIFPIITQSALFTIVNHIPKFFWKIIGEDMRKGNLNNGDLILSFSQLYDSVHRSFYNDGTIIPRLYFDIHIKYNEMVERHDKEGCDQFNKLVSVSSVVFVNNESKQINVDYDLALKLIRELSNKSCGCLKRFQDIAQSIIDFLK
jgi:hypothetical protein